jgi:oligopeptide/dipeptide ABC transporter ATP-binding protein
MNNTNIVEMQDLSKQFRVKVAGPSGPENRNLRAVSGISMKIRKGETLALVGESGCGKTTLGRLLALFYKPSTGALHINGKNVAGLNRRQLKPIRRQVQMIFQDPVSSLNPRHTVEAILTEPMKIFSLYPSAERQQKAKALLDAVGLPGSDLKKYPHEFSGGQRQRISIARALVLNPPFIVADEPVSALDVSVQSQILNLMADLREEFQLTYLFISHDLAVVHHIADRIAVMYLGRIVEVASRQELFDNPVHPYTKALLSSVPSLTPNKQRIGRILSGDPPSPLNPPSGCAFHPRCPMATDNCSKKSPTLESSDRETDHLVSCHLREEMP